MNIYVFANQKGGVGKTTIALGIGCALARRGSRVLLIDCDPQASATKVLGVTCDGRRTVADALLEPGRYRLMDAICPTTWGVDVAASETALASREARRMVGDESVLREQLARVDGGYDVVLVDCPPSLGLLTLNALVAASHLVLVNDRTELSVAAGHQRVAGDARFGVCALQPSADAGGGDRQPRRAHH